MVTKLWITCFWLLILLELISLSIYRYTNIIVGVCILFFALTYYVSKIYAYNVLYVLSINGDSRFLVCVHRHMHHACVCATVCMQVCD